MVLSLFKKENSKIGVDIGSRFLKMAQLKIDGRTPVVIEAGCEQVPDGVESGTPEWQRWAAQSIKKLIAENKFKSKDAVSSLPGDEIFIDHVKIGKNEENIEKTVFNMVKSKLSFDPGNAMVKCVYNDTLDRKSKRDVVVMVADKVKVDRHIAIFEKAGLDLRGMSVWPLAITTVYTKFFARRAADSEFAAMILDIGANYSNVIVTKGQDLLFARVIPVGFNMLNTDAACQQLLSELTACARYFESMDTGLGIGKILFFTGQSVDKNVCEKVAELAKQMHVPAQLGDVLTAVEMNGTTELLTGQHGSRLGWATSFGLSLSE